MDEANNPNRLPETGYMRLPSVLAVVPVSKSTLWNWIAAGRFPAPHHLGPRTTAWEVGQVRAWLAERATATESKSA